MNRLFLILVLLSLNTSCSSQKLAPNRIKKAVEQFTSDSCFKAAGISLVISDTENNKIISELNSDMVLSPASSQKLITTASALEILGSDYQFKTAFLSDGKIENGLLKGNLIIKAYGDPTLNSKYFPEQKDISKQIIEKLKALNIRTIQGKIIINTDYFATSIPATWIWEDIGNYYGTVPHSLTYCDNMYSLFFESGKAGTLTKIKNIVPFKTGLSFENKVLSSTVNRDLAYIFGGNTSPKRRIEGSIPQNRKNFIVKGALHSPEISLLYDLQQELKANNISVKNSLIKTEKTREIFTILSPPLKDIIFQTNQKSINLFADHILFEIGHKQNGIASWKSGIKAIKEYWDKKNTATKYISLYDGSGLSHFNSVSASFFNQLMAYMYNSSNKKIFIESLPIAGKSGTLKSFGKNTSIELNWKAKTGSMTGVRSYCGYLKSSSGKTYSISLIINNYKCSSSELKNKVVNLLINIYNS
nr:D-alanyl-D-alanine carboxypeptidase/D-alanyl-D-alanine-endopeptidase [uncultured Marinifilum sp.]